MNKIFSFLNLPADKANHVFWLTFAFAIMVISGIVVPFFALVIVTVIAVAKEVYDYLHRNRHTPDVWDFIAGILPAGILFFIQRIMS